MLSPVHSLLDQRSVELELSEGHREFGVSLPRQQLARTAGATGDTAKWPPVKRLTPRRFETTAPLHITVYIITTSVLTHKPAAGSGLSFHRLPLT